MVLMIEVGKVKWWGAMRCGRWGDPELLHLSGR